MAYPNLKQSVWLVVLLYLIKHRTVLCPLSILSGILDQDLISNPYFNGFVTLVSFFLVIYAQRRTDRTWPDILLFRTVPWGLYLAPWRFLLLDGNRSQSPSWKSGYIT